MGEVAADLPALNSFADRTAGRRDQLDQVRNRMNAVHLPRDAFGYIPGIGNRVHDAYEDFVDDCAGSATDVTDAVLSLAEAVRETVQWYASTDQAAAATLTNAGGSR